MCLSDLALLMNEKPFLQYRRHTELKIINYSVFLRNMETDVHFVMLWKVLLKSLLLLGILNKTPRKPFLLHTNQETPDPLGWKLFLVYHHLVLVKMATCCMERTLHYLSVSASCTHTYVECITATECLSASSLTRRASQTQMLQEC